LDKGVTRQNSRLPNVWYEIKSKCKFIHEMLSSLYAQEFISLLSSMHRRLYADPDISSSSFGDLFKSSHFLYKSNGLFFFLVEQQMLSALSSTGTPSIWCAREGILL